MSDRGGPHRDFGHAFLAAHGSPNRFTHHATCSNSVHNAHMSLAGLARNGVAYDYDREFTTNWITGLDEFAAFADHFTPEFAEQASGVPARTIVQLARDVAEAAPHVILHPGWMTAWRSEDFDLRRAIYTLNALLGTYESPGGLVFPKGAGHCGVKLQKLTSIAPKPETSERCDGLGTEIKHLGKGWRLVQTTPDVATTSKPYPIKASIVMRHDPMASLPDPDAFLEGLNHLDLVVSFDVN